MTKIPTYEHSLPTIERDGTTIELTRDEALVVYRQLERERQIGYVYDMLAMLYIKPGNEWPLSAYVQAYLQEEERNGEYVTQDDLDYYGDVFDDESKMTEYRDMADEGDEFLWWEVYGGSKEEQPS